MISWGRYYAPTPPHPRTACSQAPLKRSQDECKNKDTQSSRTASNKRTKKLTHEGSGTRASFYLAGCVIFSLKSWPVQFTWIPLRNPEMQNGGTSQISALKWTYSCTICSDWNTHNHVPYTQVLSSIHRYWPSCCICEKAWEEVLFPIAEVGCLGHSHAPGDSQVFSNIISPLWKAWSWETGLEHWIPELYPSLLYE